MLEALDLHREHRVLEIGTGSGYVTAILASLATHVVSIDRFHTLAAGARTRLEILGFDDVEVICGDAFATDAPGRFDRILVHLALEGVPASLASLLAPGGVLVCGRVPEEGRGIRLSRLALDTQGQPEETDCGACQLPKPIVGAAAAL
jgi:protein-L-isoaspartate(D-aspartate) O-methyltransferase